MRIGIIGAMEIEVQVLKNLMDNAKIEKISGIEFYSGNINGTDMVVAVAGVGKVNAAVCAEAMILRYAPDCLINVGVAGGLSSELKIGDIAVATAVVEHDMDTTPIGDEKGFITGINKVYMDCDARVSEMMYNAVKKLGINAVKGVIASGDQFIASDAQRQPIINEFNAIAAEMEGASIGHVCTMNAIPFAVLRAISDGADSGSHMDFPTFAKMAAENSVKIILEFLKEIK